MWQIYGVLAMDIARERQREARDRAMVRAARTMAAEERRRHGGAIAPGSVRGMMAALLRRASGAFDAVSEAACAAATRIDGRTA